MPLPAVLDPVERVGPEGGAQPREAAPVRLELPGIATAFRVRPAEPLAFEATDQRGAARLVDPAGSEIHGCTLGGNRTDGLFCSWRSVPSRLSAAGSGSRLLPGLAPRGPPDPGRPVVLPRFVPRRGQPPP